jgi:hypothetical protein
MKPDPVLYLLVRTEPYPSVQAPKQQIVNKADKLLAMDIILTTEKFFCNVDTWNLSHLLRSQTAGSGSTG